MRSGASTNPSCLVRRREDAFWGNGKKTVLWCRKSDLQAECGSALGTAGHQGWWSQLPMASGSEDEPPRLSVLPKAAAVCPGS